MGLRFPHLRDGNTASYCPAFLRQWLWVSSKSLGRPDPCPLGVHCPAERSGGIGQLSRPAQPQLALGAVCLSCGEAGCGLWPRRPGSSRCPPDPSALRQCPCRKVHRVPTCRPRVEQVESRASVGAPASPACSLGSSQPLQLGLGPQTCEHGNSRSASWVVLGVNPRRRGSRKCIRGSRGGSRLPGGPRRQLRNGAGPVATQDPAGTCLGQCYFFIPLYRREN